MEKKNLLPSWQPRQNNLNVLTQGVNLMEVTYARCPQQLLLTPWYLGNHMMMAPSALYSHNHSSPTNTWVENDYLFLVIHHHQRLSTCFTNSTKQTKNCVAS